LAARPVHATRFSPSPSTSVLTASDDTTVRLWDLATADNTAYFDSHTDYVRTAAFLPSDPSLAVSGSYDTTVKLWDSRQQENGGEVRTLEHGYPVESVIVHPSGTIAVSAGGPLIRVWDLLSGSTRCLKALSNHQKTVTCLTWDGERKRVLSGGLDGLVKVYQVDAGQWRVGHTMRYGGQILSLALSVRISRSSAAASAKAKKGCTSRIIQISLWAARMDRSRSESDRLQRANSPHE
jgi:U3 small nucleolar RNA-associated protein 15